MSNAILIVYASRHGSTQDVATEIVETLRETVTARVDLRPVDAVESLAGYDAVVLGSAVQFGTWLPEALDFARRFQRDLERLPVALFSVHIQNTGSDAFSRNKRHSYLDDVVRQVRPADIAFFTGRFDREGATTMLPRFIARFVPTVNLINRGKVREWAATIPALLTLQPAH